MATLCVWSLLMPARSFAQAAPDAAVRARRGNEAAQRMTSLEQELARQRTELSEMRAELERMRTQAAEAQAAAAAQAEAKAAVPPAELAELISGAAEPTATPSVLPEPLLRLYGFADVGLQRMWADRGVAELVPGTNKTTFVLGNLNLYFDANPSKDFRFLAEIRFGTFPDGSTPQPKGWFGAGQPIDTSVSDPSAANSAFTGLKWAGVSPQRAHIDWTPSDLFNVRAGLFLTPYGIWNVDHGTPTRIMVSEPLFMSTQLIPMQLIGIEAFGTLHLLPWTIGYHLHVSNGRTIHQVDFSDNKAIGGRLYASTRFPFPFKVGISGYAGDSSDTTSSLGTLSTTFAYDEWALSGDVSIDLGALRIRSEVVSSWQYYKAGLRRTIAGVPMADAQRVGAYLVIAYQLPWLGIEPLILAEFLRVPVPRTLPVGEGMIMPAVGVNVYFTATTMLRTQFAMMHGYDLSANPVRSEGFLYQAAARLITAF